MQRRWLGPLLAAPCALFIPFGCVQCMNSVVMEENSRIYEHSICCCGRETATDSSTCRGGHARGIHVYNNTYNYIYYTYTLLLRIANRETFSIH